MQIDLRTVSLKPLRQTFSNVARRLGDKPASRYLEGTLDVQASANFHYRPLWEPEREIHDPARTAIQMKDWYAFKDPRQYYYGTYVMARGRQQEAAEAAFTLVEERNLVALVPPEVRKIALETLVPLRHVEWAGNLNHAAICAYGYGTAITQPAIFHAMDHLGMAQYLTRIGLVLDGPGALDEAKADWLGEERWQGLRRYVEDTLVAKDWFELLVAQGLVLEGLLFPLVFNHVDRALAARGGTPLSMMTRFMAEWFEETSRWVDAQLRIAAGESPANEELLGRWARQWRDRAVPALEPVARHALGAEAPAVLDRVATDLNARALKAGLAL
jgi:phenol/toluene 2-monooxygenase (NADH) P1/A1